ncbi:MAG: hypothetical protein KDD45_01865 [Bdellovibrionales bacterium]|nr:hypothetical protein [Bdellovibrionales bacterium]
MELLRDPSYWISAPALENFLQSLVNQKWKNKYNQLAQEVGHHNPSLHAWGVLDSVLKMMTHPREIFHQPDKFLAYFISPEPPIENLIKNEKFISFDLPLVAEQYPVIAQYLVAALESLPKYSGQSLAQCEWQHIHLKITWPQISEPLFQKEEAPQISPVFLQNIIEELQKNQKDLEEKNRELMRVNDELLLAQKRLDKSQFSKSKDENQFSLTSENIDSTPQISIGIDESLDQESNLIGQNLARLHDYMVRAQQLITILSSQAKMNSGIKVAMKRMDWDYVKSQYPATISECIEALRKLQKK